jgi:hypothetical protein
VYRLKTANDRYWPTVFAASTLCVSTCIAVASDEELAAAVAHYESIIYSSVANRVSSDIENADLTDQQATEWIEAITNRLAVCDLEALTYLGSDVREESIHALANGAGRKSISQIVSIELESDPNFKATLSHLSGYL